MSQFMKSMCKIAIPVTLQSMLQASFSIVDQLMIGQLGETNIAAVGICGNYSMLVSVLFSAVGAVAGILIAQFLGAEDRREAWSSFTVSMVLCGMIAILFCAASFLAPAGILGLYTKDTLILGAGCGYLRLIAVTFLPMGVSTILSVWLRCREHATATLVASLCAVVVNTVGNYILIFGKMGAPALGITGAGIATLTSQLLNLLILAACFIGCLHKDADRMQLSLHFDKLNKKEYLLMICPILISEFLWSLGQNVESAVYGHLGTQNLAAYTLTCPVQGLMVGALSGLSAAAGVLIGKRLGKKEYDAAYEESGKIMKAGLLGAVVVSGILMLFSGSYVSFYRVDTTVQELGQSLLFVFAFYAPVKIENMILGGGILKSGGDTKTVMLIDIVGTWGMGIPLCFAGAYLLQWGIVGVYALLTSEEILRLVISLIIFRKKKWMISLA